MKWMLAAVVGCFLSCSSDQGAPGVDEGPGGAGEGGGIAGEEAGAAGEASPGGADSGQGGNGAGQGDAGAGGQNGGAGGEPDVVVIESIAVSPLNTLLEVDISSAAEQGFTATASYSDGSTADVTDAVTWSINNDALGSFNLATLDVPAFAEVAAQSGLVSASLDGLEGVAQLTVVAHHVSGPDRDVLLILPFQESPVAEEVELTPAVSSLDVLLLMDVTGSMGNPIDSLAAGLSTVFPAVRSVVADTQFGVAAYADFPISPFGGAFTGYTPDQPFFLRQAITSIDADVATGVAGLGDPLAWGDDSAEAMIEALYQAATGDGLNGPAPTSVPANHAGIGGAQFRAGALPVIVAISDAMSHAPGEATPGACQAGYTIDYSPEVNAVAHTRGATGTALNNVCARVVGVATGAASPWTQCTAGPDLQGFATVTKARVPPEVWGAALPAGCALGQCCVGQNGVGVYADADGLCPLVYATNATGAGLSAHVSSAVSLLARYGTMDVSLLPSGAAQSTDGVELPLGKTTADFVQSIAAQQAEPAELWQTLPAVDDDRFVGAAPGSTLTFSVQGSNDFVEPGDDALLFTGLLQARGDGCFDVGARNLYVVVPPADLPSQ